MNEAGFFSRIFGGGANEDETRIFSPEELRREESGRKEPEEEQHGGFTVERAAEIIKGLPPDVSRESAVRIVRGTLVAAGIRFEDLERSTRARETRLRSEIDLARGRQEELKQRTEEVLRSLEEDMRKAREARDNGVTEEDERISRANSGLQDIRQVRGFFDFRDEYAEAPAVAEPGEQTADHEGPPAEQREAPFAPQVGDETRVMEPYDDADETRVIRRSDPLAGPEDAGER
jgi:hypothetical protein